MVTKKIKITIKPLEESFKETRKFFSNLDKGIIKQHTPTINFEDFNTYKKFLTQKRLDLLNIIKTTKPKTIKHLSVMANRNFKNIHEDIKILESLELIQLKKTRLGLMPVVLYDEIDLNIKIPLTISR
ncbi:hypothetical protein CL618_00620 [archaeon]|nr:hypothetical protein [archaeon]|tara:strand:- start:5108 stop:5491 length:384 start_codon:yes stop_codon:yes gene_type:complete